MRRLAAVAAFWVGCSVLTYRIGKADLMRARAEVRAQYGIKEPPVWTNDNRVVTLILSASGPLGLVAVSISYALNGYDGSGPASW